MTRKVLNKKVKKSIAVAMSTMLVMSSSSFHVLADTPAQTASDSNATVSTTFGDGTLENPAGTETITTTIDPNTGNITTIVDVTITGTGTDENGATVNLEEFKETLTLTDSEGDILAQSGGHSGHETIIETSEPTTTTEEIDITPTDNTTTETGKTDTTTETGTFDTISTTGETATEEIDLGYAGDISVDLKPGETKTESIETDESQLASQNLTTPTDSTTTETDPETGITTTTEVEVEPIYDSEGNVIGYTTTTTVTTEDPITNTETEQIGEPSTDITVGETAADVNTTTAINLPDKPTASESVDGTTGNKTIVTVEELLDENGNVVGYQSTTVTTDANGATLGYEVETLFGTKTTTTTTETTPTTTTTTTNNKVTTTTTTVITEATTASGQKVVATNREVTASMTQVTANGTHGSVKTTSIVPDTSIQPSTDGTADWEAGGTDLRNPVETVETGGFNGYDFQYQGNYGLESAIGVDLDPNDGKNTHTTVHQFVLKGKDNTTHYVLCADYGTNARKTYNYNMENVEDATYYSDEEAKIINNIALTGYWGTTSGAGSFDNLKTTLNAALQDATANNETFFLTQYQIDNLTEGEALTATQAAIWYYANCSTTEQLDTNDITSIAYIGNETYKTLAELDAAKGLTEGTTEATVNGLYQYLINLGPLENDQSTTFITEDNFAANANILVGDLAVDENGQLLLANTDDDDTNDVYDTDVTFSLAIEPSTINDDLIVTVYDSTGKPIAKKRLAGDDRETNYGRIDRNADGTYTIDNLQITEGLSITLNLSGTQHLDNGVYLYSSEVKNEVSAQTFIGIAQGKRDVNLNVSLNFTVDEPTAQIESTSSGETKEKTDKVTETRTDTTSESTVKATVVITTEIEEKTERAWEGGWGYEVVPEELDDDDPKDPDEPKEKDDPKENDKPKETPKKNEEPEQPIPEVVDVVEVLGATDIPTEVLGATDLMALAPATGDTSTLWMALTALSGLLLSGFSIFDKKRKKSTLK